MKKKKNRTREKKSKRSPHQITCRKYSSYVLFLILLLYPSISGFKKSYLHTLQWHLIYSSASYFLILMLAFNIVWIILPKTIHRIHTYIHMYVIRVCCVYGVLRHTQHYYYVWAKVCLKKEYLSFIWFTKKKSIIWLRIVCTRN